MTIGDQEEDEFVTRMAAHRQLWIGLTDERKEGKFRWVDSTLLKYDKWDSGEPSNWRGKEHYVALKRNELWNDFQNDDRAIDGYICEWDY